MAGKRFSTNTQIVRSSVVAVAVTLLTSCGQSKKDSAPMGTDSISRDTVIAQGTYGYDVNFLKKHHGDVLELHSADDKSRLVIVPGYQGRVMTSTAGGTSGTSFGWINYDLISAKKAMPHIHAFGGEERFWLGPEGGQFSIYFRKGVPFVYDNWQVPKEIDTEAFQLAGSSSTEARFEKDMHLENYSGNKLDLKVNRNIRLLDKAKIDSLLGIQVDSGLDAVGFETENIVTNIGQTAWTKKTGLLSIWILSMMNASERTTVAVPFVKGDEQQLGKVVTDDYFGKVPADRLVVKDGIILFKTDAKYRSKIGVAPKRARPYVASYDAVNGVLTIANFTLPGTTDYVNSMWEIQKDPFRGDAVNSYNDGPVNGAQMGNVYEIESSSPAAALAPNASLTHYHRTMHFKGSADKLNAIATKLLGVTVDQINL